MYKCMENNKGVYDTQKCINVWKITRGLAGIQKCIKIYENI